jgi:hypothetical protein
MAEWYARDASRKLKAVYQSKGHSGKRTSNNCIYGYLKDPQDKSKWLIDPIAATIVRRIFALSVEGKGPLQIAKILEVDAIETPGVHQAKMGVGTRKSATAKHPCRWSSSTIIKILAKPEYMGHTVNFRTKKESFKDKKQTWNAQEDWVIFENTHEAIVDAETWQTAQRCRAVKRRTDITGEANPLTGLLHCTDCGKRLHNHRHGNHNHYLCPTYNARGPMCEVGCTAHYISSKAVNALLLETIKRTTAFAREHEAAFVNLLREASEIKQSETAKAHRQNIAKHEKRIAELDLLFRKTYEDFAAGRLTENRFDLLSSGYEAEQVELQEQTAKLQQERAQFDSDNMRTDKFMDLVRRYTDFAELTPAMLHEFVEKVVVHEADKSSGRRVQQVDIFLNFIGQFDVPGDDAVEDEFGEQQCAKWREYKRQQRQKCAA